MDGLCEGVGSGATTDRSESRFVKPEVGMDDLRLGVCFEELDGSNGDVRQVAGSKGATSGFNADFMLSVAVECKTHENYAHFHRKPDR